MKLPRVIAAARSPAGRLIAVTCGVAAVVWILRGIGVETVARVLAGTAFAFPIVLALEAGISACTMMAVRSTYGPAGARIPAAQLIRAGLVAYAIAGLVPAGRAVAEVTRATMLSRWVGAARAAASAGQMQGVALIANSFITIPAAVAAALSPGPWWLWLAIAGNSLLTMVLGASVLIVGRRSRFGAWLAKRSPRREGFGKGLDEALAEGPILPPRAVAWETLGRLLQVAQQAVLVAAVGGVATIKSAFASEGIMLVGAAIGDLVPAQIGVIEGNFTLSATALGLAKAAAVSVALLMHLAQLAWVLVGSIVPAVWPPPPEAAGDVAAQQEGSAP